MHEAFSYYVLECLPLIFVVGVNSDLFSMAFHGSIGRLLTLTFGYATTNAFLRQALVKRIRAMWHNRYLPATAFLTFSCGSNSSHPCGPSDQFTLWIFPNPGARKSIFVSTKFNACSGVESTPSKSAVSIRPYLPSSMLLGSASVRGSTGSVPWLTRDSHPSCNGTRPPRLSQKATTPHT